MYVVVASYINHYVLESLAIWESFNTFVPAVMFCEGLLKFMPFDILLAVSKSKY